MRLAFFLLFFWILTACSRPDSDLAVPASAGRKDTQWNDLMNQAVLKDHESTLSRPFPVNETRPNPLVLLEASRVQSENRKNARQDEFILGQFDHDDAQLKQIYIASVRETVWQIEKLQVVRVPIFGLIRGVRVEVDEHYGLPTFPMGCIVEEAFIAERAGVLDTLDWYLNKGIQLPGSASSKICKVIPPSLEWSALGAPSGGATLKSMEGSSKGDSKLGAFTTPRSWIYQLQLGQASFNFTRGFRPPEAWAYDSQSKTVWFQGWIDGALGYQDSLIVQIDPITGAILATFPWSSDRPKPDPLINFDMPSNSPMPSHPSEHP